MKKIMFNDKYCLTEAVLQGNKTMTRRLVKNENLLQWLHEMEVDEYFRSLKGTILDKYISYKIGDVVAVAQSYKDIKEYNPESYEDVMLDQGTICEASHPYSHLMKSGGWDNKMFVRAALMTHHIKITDIKVERLHDISEEDCLREGIFKWDDPFRDDRVEDFGFFGATKHYMTAKSAFAALIDKVSGKGTWKRNPWVFVYSFELFN